MISPKTRAALLDSVARLQRDAGLMVAFASNYRPALWEDAATARVVTGRAWALADIALPLADDEMALFGDADTGAAARPRLPPRRAEARPRGPVADGPGAGVTWALCRGL